MQLTEEQVIEFQRIYKKEFGVDLSVADAREKGLLVIGLVVLMHAPLTRAELNAVIETRRRQSIMQVLTYPLPELLPVIE